MELHFYPGQKLLVVLDKFIVHGRFEAWGGPASIGNDPRMPEEPTWPGEYVIDKAHAYRTNTWPLSRIAWGTPLRDMPGQNDVWYQLPGGKWGSIKADTGITRNDIVNLNFNLYNARMVPRQWVFNDFGPVAIRWFKDLNGNRILDGKERLSGQMFHTTQKNEAQHTRGLPIAMAPSHGCIHLRPVDRDRLFAVGAFKPGTRFVVRKYYEKY